jgi:rhodanese-related sulfurtransferase
MWKQMFVNLSLSILFLLGQFGCSRGLASKLLYRFLPGTVLSYFQQLVRRHFPAVKQISPADCEALIARQGDDIVLLDVRDTSEYQVSHLAGSRLTPLNTSLESLASQLTPSNTVIVMCSVGYRSSILAVNLQKLTKNPIYNMEGSVFRWAMEGRPLVSSTGAPVTKVHPYNHLFGSMLPRTMWPSGWKPVAV